MFTLYQNRDFILYYEDKNDPKGFTHLLTFKSLNTDERVGMWIDPTGTGSSSDFLLMVKHLEELKGQVDEKAYEHEVACFIEALIANGGYTSLKISSLAATILKHHRNPWQLKNTLENLDLSYIRFADRDLFSSVEEMRVAISGFIAILQNFIAELLNLPPEEIKNPLMAQKSENSHSAIQIETDEELPELEDATPPSSPLQTQKPKSEEKPAQEYKVARLLEGLPPFHRTNQKLSLFSSSSSKIPSEEPTSESDMTLS